jgi:hypothetical protein
LKTSIDINPTGMGRTVFGPGPLQSDIVPGIRFQGLFLRHTIQASDSERIDTAVREARQVASEGPFLPQWESLEKYEIPAWYKDAKLGMTANWSAQCCWLATRTTA